MTDDATIDELIGELQVDRERAADRERQRFIEDVGLILGETLMEALAPSYSNQDLVYRRQGLLFTYRDVGFFIYRKDGQYYITRYKAGYRGEWTLEKNAVLDLLRVVRDTDPKAE